MAAFDDNVIDKANSLASLGGNAKDFLRANITFLDNAKVELRGEIGDPLYYKWKANYASNDTILSITLGTKTLITLSSSHYRHDESYVYLYDIVDNGLFILNGRHKTEYVSDTSFYIDVDTTYADAYTSGGKAVDAVWNELKMSLAWLLLYYALPSLIDIKEGDHSVVLAVYRQFGEGNANPSIHDAIDWLRGVFYNNALKLVRKNVGDGTGSDEWIQIVDV